MVHFPLQRKDRLSSGLQQRQLRNSGRLNYCLEQWSHYFFHAVNTDAIAVEARLVNEVEKAIARVIRF
jgi:hypothetical protein